MEPYTNETQAALERAIKKFLNENKELALRRILGLDGLDIEAAEDKDINVNTYGTGKAYYNGVEIGTVGGGVTSFALRTGPVSPIESDYAAWYLKLSGGTLTGGLTMLAAIDMNGNAINSLPLNRDWSTLEILDSSALCRDDIDGPSGMLNKEFLLNGIMDAGIGKIVLPHNDNVPANCVVGQIIWEPDAGRLWIGKAINEWKEIAGGGTPATTVTDETTFGISKAVGTLTSYAREDHTHGSPAHSKAVHDALDIDADTLDNYHAAAFLLLTGGTLSGDLTLYSPSVIPQLRFYDIGGIVRGQILPYSGDLLVNATQGWLYLSGSSGVKIDMNLAMGNHNINFGDTYGIDFRNDGVHKIYYGGATPNDLVYSTYQKHRFYTTADTTTDFEITSTGIRCFDNFYLRKGFASDTCYIVNDAFGTMELHVPSGQKFKFQIG